MIDPHRSRGFTLQTRVRSTAVNDTAAYFLPLDVSTRFGRRLRELRRERNYTQVRLAADFGIDPTYIDHVECGRRSVSLSTLEVIAFGMNLRLSELLKDL